MRFVPRFEAPTIDNLNYIKTTYGGYNKCIVIDAETGQVIPNCVGYSWGRFIECQGLTDCNLSRGNATNWYGNTSDGYERGALPKLGAVICYSGGSDNAGHVASVEQVNDDYSIIVSESTIGGVYFRTKTLYPPLYFWGGLYTFQGFIYPDTDFGIKTRKNNFKWIFFSKSQKDKRK